MNRKLQYAILSADVLWIGGAFALAHLLGVRADISRSGWAVVSNRVPLVLAAVLVWIILYFNKKLEGFCRGWHLPTVCAQVTVGVGYVIGALLLMVVWAEHDLLRELLYMGGLLPLGFIGIRCSARRLLITRTARKSKRKVVILGAGRTAQELAQRISFHSEMSMEVAGMLYPSKAEPARQSTTTASRSMAVRSLDIVNLLQNKNVRELIIVEPVPPGSETQTLLANCRKAGMRIHLVPQRYELYVSKAKIEEIGHVPLLSLEEKKLPAAAVKVKRCIDVLGALLLLALNIPLLAAAAAAIYCTKKSALRKELRCGKGGTTFWMYRLNIDRDEKDLCGWARMLVRFSATELPQLWNVLKGDMSLVGPRPESPDRVRRYSAWQRQRLGIPPGLTGLAQVRGLREEHSSEEKAQFDLQYISQWSLFLDLSLLLQTAWALLERIVKQDPDKVLALQSKLVAFGPRRMMHADRAQSGAD